MKIVRRLTTQFGSPNTVKDSCVSDGGWCIKSRERKEKKIKNTIAIFGITNKKICTACEG